MNRWEIIQDLPSNVGELIRDELDSLASVWRDQSNKLKDSNAIKEFNEKLKRQWAIETGIIEGIYNIDRGTTELLIKRGIETSLVAHGSTDKPAEEVVTILKDHQEVLEGLFDFITSERTISTGYIKEIHSALTAHQDFIIAVDSLGRNQNVPLLKGEYKKLPNNPTRPDGSIHYYCPPEHVASEMDRLINMHLSNQEKGISPLIQAAWFHHRFTQIHPFQDGNGRVARALASLLFLKNHWFPLVISRDHRDEYIRALEEADTGNLQELVDLFATIQKNAFIKALSASETILKHEVPLKHVVAGIKDRLDMRRQEYYAQLRSVFSVGDHLCDFARKLFTDTAVFLEDQLNPNNPSFKAVVDTSSEQNDFWFKRQIIHTAHTFEYYADTKTYRKWTKLKLLEDPVSQMVVSFHSLGVEFTGVLAASAFIEFRTQEEDNQDQTYAGPKVICEEVFTFSYSDDKKRVKTRFENWLKRVIIIGIDQWRRQL